MFAAPIVNVEQDNIALGKVTFITSFRFSRLSQLFGYIARKSAFSDHTGPIKLVHLAKMVSQGKSCKDVSMHTLLIFFFN